MRHHDRHGGRRTYRASPLGLPHIAGGAAWPSVQQHGLLSTQRLIDLFDVDTAERNLILTSPRKESIVLRAPGRPPAVIRDQKPMKFIAEKIDSGSSLVEYLLAINSRVFWASPERLGRLRQAREYRADEQVILHVNTRAPVDRHGPRIRLCRLNSGAVTQKNHPVRGHRSWLPIAVYPYGEYRCRYGSKGAMAEVTVLDAVPDILHLIDKIEGVAGDQGVGTLATILEAAQAGRRLAADIPCCWVVKWRRSCGGPRRCSRRRGCWFSGSRGGCRRGGFRVGVGRLGVRCRGRAGPGSRSWRRVSL
jgi:hypothetical protein